MPIVYRADRTLSCTISIWHGHVTRRDQRRQAIQLSSDPTWPAGPRHLVDGTTITTLTMPEPDLLELLYQGTELVDEMRVAALVRPGFFNKPRGAYKTPSHEFHIAVFTDLDAASYYLGLDRMAVEAVIDELRHQL